MNTEVFPKIRSIIYMYTELVLIFVVGGNLDLDWVNVCLYEEALYFHTQVTFTI